MKSYLRGVGEVDALQRVTAAWHVRSLKSVWLGLDLESGRAWLELLRQPATLQLLNETRKEYEVLLRSQRRLRLPSFQKQVKQSFQERAIEYVTWSAVVP